MFTIDTFGACGFDGRTLLVGETVGNFRIEAKLAEGGMGAVYRALHPLLGKSAAVKVLLPELSSNREVVNRFFNEARAATAIRHPGIVEVYDFGYLASGIAYIVMELLDGETLSRRLASAGRLDEATALLYLRGMASAIAAAHAQQIVHRDLKPDNVFLVPDPDMPTGVRVKLLDFGIAKVAEAIRGAESTKTRTGSVMGTPTYMSPEQCRGAGEIDHRSDLYSLGCILYEMVTGRPPFAAEGVGEIIAAHLFVAPTPPSQVVPGISTNLDALVMCLLAKNPGERIQSAAELVRLLGSGTNPAVLSNLGGVTMTAPTPITGMRNVAAPVTMPIVASAPTTLGGAAAEATMATGPKRSRTGLYALLALAVSGGVVAAVLATRGGGEREPGAASSQREPADAAAAPPEPLQTPLDAGVAVVLPDAGAVTASATPDAGVDAAVPDKNEQDDKGRRSGRSGRRNRTDRGNDGKTGKTGDTSSGSGSNGQTSGGVDRGD